MCSETKMKVTDAVLRGRCETFAEIKIKESKLKRKNRPLSQLLATEFAYVMHMHSTSLSLNIGLCIKKTGSGHEKGLIAGDCSQTPSLCRRNPYLVDTDALLRLASPA